MGRRQGSGELGEALVVVRIATAGPAIHVPLPDRTSSMRSVVRLADPGWIRRRRKASRRPEEEGRSAESGNLERPDLLLRLVGWKQRLFQDPWFHSGGQESTSQQPSTFTFASKRPHSWLRSCLHPSSSRVRNIPPFSSLGDTQLHPFGTRSASVQPLVSKPESIETEGRRSRRARTAAPRWTRARLRKARFGCRGTVWTSVRRAGDGRPGSARVRCGPRSCRPRHTEGTWSSSKA